MAQYALKNIKTNPFRQMDRYPIRQDKIQALEESIRKTGFWDNIVARISPNSSQHAEVAYGHHRLAALRNVFGPNHKVELIIRKLDNETMIQIMARENMQEWTHNVSVEHETVRAVVLAFANGQIKLPEVPSKTKNTTLRIAPSFKLLNPQDDTKGMIGDIHRSYTAKTLAEFLAWMQPDKVTPQDKVTDALDALALIEIGLMKESDFEDLNKTGARQLIRQTRQAFEMRQAQERLQQQKPHQTPHWKTDSHTLAKRIAETASRQLKDKHLAASKVHEVARNIIHEDLIEQPKPKPDIYDFFLKTRAHIFSILGTTDPLVTSLNELLTCCDDIDDGNREDFAKTLELVGQRFLTYAQSFRKPIDHTPLIDGHSPHIRFN